MQLHLSEKILNEIWHFINSSLIMLWREANSFSDKILLTSY